MLVFSATAGKLLLNSRFWPPIGGAVTGFAAAKLDKSALQTEEIKEMARHILFGQGAILHGVPSVNNPFSKEPGVTKPTAYALNSVLSNLGLREGNVATTTELMHRTLDGSYLFFGGPVANQNSREVLGVGKHSPLLRTSLPLSFDIVRPVESDERVLYADRTGDRPAWKLLVNGRPESVADDRGRQTRDYLLLTSIPNIYSKGGIASDRIVVAGGVHGAGTRAIDLLFSNPSILDRLMKETRGKDGWQALIPITQLDSETAMPLKMGLPAIYEVRADFGLLHDLYKGRRFGEHA